MPDLLTTVLDAHGGRARWREVRRITARQFLGGALWGPRGRQGVLNDAEVTVDLRRRSVTQKPFPNADHRAPVTVGRVALEVVDGTRTGTGTGTGTGEPTGPRAPLAGQDPSTPWARRQPVHFCAGAMWTCLAEPASLTFPGVRTEEIGPWSENGERFRRLRVLFPAHMAALGPEQILYVDSDGLVRRRDHEVRATGSTPAVHYVSGHQEFSGLVVPTTRMIYGRDESGHRIPAPLVGSVRLEDVRVH
ncbi:hypothetical protein ACF061_20730 [Streptomyces sp. NPDC015220]|uniref:hypothetical protein n=1 Tax=Streptomyces sp. NPDC015220 TaxID=3364947 RepID=UPI0036F75FB5